MLLNASFVGLLVQPDGAPRPSGGHPTDGLADHECVGYGLVRSVDEHTGTIFVLTPVPLATLERVDVLARVGPQIEAPLALLQPTAVTVCSPYLQIDVLQNGPGTKQMRSRNDVPMRRR